ncbi:autotransporter domain-containing protein [bacterium]|jgi:uncharacterized protein with beta-barrel porin domain|nr:autotransporter domain-containing protein [bacterium]
MKRAPLFLISIFLSFAACPLFVSAEVQDIGAGSTPVDPLTGQVDGVNFTADGEATLTDGQPLNSNFTNPVAATTEEDGTGTLTFTGSSLVWGNAGEEDGALKTVNLTGDNTTTVEITDNLYANTLNFGGDGESIIGGMITLGTVTNSSGVNNSGNLFFHNSSTVTGNVGAAGAALNTVCYDDNNGVIDLQGDVFAATLSFGEGEEHSEGEIQIDGTAALGVVSTLYDDFGTLTFGGNATVTGNTGGAGVMLKVINADGESTLIDLQGDVYAGVLNFGGDGEVRLHETMSFDSVTNTTSGQGTLTLNGAAALTCDIGSTGAGIKLLNVGYGLVTLDGDILAVATNFAGDNELQIADGHSITGAVTTFTNNTGTLTFAGTSTMTGQIGTSTNLLKKVNVGAWPAKVTFNNDIYATEIYVEDDGEIEFADGVDYNRNAAAGSITTESDSYGYLLFKGSSVINASVGTTDDHFYEIRLDFADPSSVAQITGDTYVAYNGVNFDHDGELQVDGDFYGPVENDSGIADTATITFGGNAEIDWLGGAGVNTLKTVNANGTGTLVEGADFYTQTINFGGDGEVRLHETMSFDSVTNTTSGQGTLTLHGAAALTCDIGSTGDGIKLLNVGYGLVTLDGDILSLSTNFAGDNELRLADGSSITGAVTNTTSGEGTLTLQGAHALVGNIGSTGAGLKLLTVGNGLVTIDGDILALATNFAGDNELRLADGHSITGAVTTSGSGTGTLTFDGATTTGGDIGVAGTPLKAVNFNGAATLAHNIAATTTTIAAGSTTTCNGDRTVTGNLTLAAAANAVLDIGTTTLDVTGVYTQNNLSKLNVGVNGTTAGQITSASSAVVSAASALNLTVSDYVPSNTTFTIIDGAAGAGVNVPGIISSNSPILTFSGTVVNGDLFITANRTNTYNTIASGNAGAVGAILEQIGAAGATGDMLTILDALDSLPDNASIQDALDTLVPLFDSGVLNGSNTMLNQFIGISTGRLEGLFAEAHNSGNGTTGISAGDNERKGIDIWGQGFGEYLRQKPRGVSNGYRATIWGTAVGGDIPAFDDKVRLGISGGYARSDINSKDNHGQTDIDSYQGTLYAGYIDGEKPYYVNGAFSFAYNTYKSSRRIVIGTDTRTAKSDYDGQQYSVIVDGGYTFSVEQFRITPIASLQYMRLHLESYTETNADALNLKVKSQNYDMLQSGLGMKFERPYETELGTLIPEIHARWLYDFIGDKQETTSTFSGGGGSFATEGFDPAQNSLNVGCKLVLITKGNWDFEANYDFEYKEDFLAHTGWVNIRYNF